MGDQTSNNYGGKFQYHVRQTSYTKPSIILEHKLFYNRTDMPFAVNQKTHITRIAFCGVGKYLTVGTAY